MEERYVGDVEGSGSSPLGLTKWGRRLPGKPYQTSSEKGVRGVPSPPSEQGGRKYRRKVVYSLTIRLRGTDECWL